MSSTRDMRAEVVIVGAGFAGAATAYRLTSAGVKDVLILEREPAPGAHASGRNAGLVRQLLDDPLLLEAAVAGAAFLRAPPPEVAAAARRGSLVAGSGSLLLAAERPAFGSDQALAMAGACRVTSDEARALAPELEGSPDAAHAFFTPLDGIADPRAVLEALLAAARAGGARLVTGCAAESLELAGKRVTGLRTSLGRIEARTVVDAAGPWAGELARAAGVAPPPLGAHRRHLFATDPAPRPPSAPFVWDVTAGVYFRPEGAGYVLSGCDEEPHPPGAADVDAARALELERKLARRAPALAGLGIARAWACLRTFAPDGRFVVGPDPRLPGYAYAAGLGGHGLTTAAFLGGLAARAVLDPSAVPAPFRAERFFV